MYFYLLDGKKGGPASPSVAPLESGDAKAKKKVVGSSSMKKDKIIPGDGEEDVDPTLLRTATTTALAKGQGAAKLHSKKASAKQTTNAASLKVGAAFVGASPEPAAGDLKASAETETGAKQRRVNKRLQAYEEKDDDGEGGVGDAKKDT